MHYTQTHTPFGHQTVGLAISHRHIHKFGWKNNQVKNGYIAYYIINLFGVVRARRQTELQSRCFVVWSLVSVSCLPCCYFSYNITSRQCILSDWSSSISRLLSIFVLLVISSMVYVYVYVIRWLCHRLSCGLVFMLWVTYIARDIDLNPVDHWWLYRRLNVSKCGCVCVISAGQYDFNCHESDEKQISVGSIYESNREDRFLYAQLSNSVQVGVKGRQTHLCPPSDVAGVEFCCLLGTRDICSMARHKICFNNICLCMLMCDSGVAVCEESWKILNHVAHI